MHAYFTHMITDTQRKYKVKAKILTKERKKRRRKILAAS